ncbi:MAG: tetratricopeptide repeat protein [Burkholderiaceae bacterium]
MTLEEALTLRKAGELEQARAALLILAREHPNDARILYETAGIHDRLGYEADAVPFYQQAITLGLPEDDLRGAFTCLGSTFRTLGRYQEALQTLRAGKDKFPQAREIDVFMAMTLHNLGRHSEAMQLLLNTLLDTCGNANINAYERALRFYAQDIDKTWT